MKFQIYYILLVLSLSFFKSERLASAPLALVDNDLFIITNLSKKQVYESEAVILTYKIYSASSILLDSMKNENILESKEFVKEEIYDENRVGAAEMFNGKIYNTMVYRQYVLYPLAVGEITIPSVQVETFIRKSKSAPEDSNDAFSNVDYIKDKKTIILPGITMFSQTLKNSPVGFKGLIGDFNVISSVSRKEMPVNDALKFKIRIIGSGNLKMIKDECFQIPDAFEIYEPVIKENTSVVDGKLLVDRELEYFIVARVPGTYSIPSITYIYYDAEHNQYRSMKTQKHIIKVNPH